MKNKLLVTFIVVVTLAVIGAAQYSKNGMYHCGRCGSEKWVFNVLFLDLGEGDYDEFGIEERWVSAHRKPCEHIWLPGPLEYDTGTYWPSLHSKIARSADWEAVLAMMKASGDAELKGKDALGRTILHWLVLSPDIEHRQMLVDYAVSRGLSWEEKDVDGLTPRDWQANSQGAR